SKIIGSLGPAVVLWTTNREVVVSQTVNKLNDDYRVFLPAATTIVGEQPTPDQWGALLASTEGVFIWCRSVASWNAPNDEGRGTEAARQTIHRPAPDSGDARSYWEQLADLNTRKRPLWVVYDESHGQTDVQLDQLLDLNPVGVIAASGSPHFSAKVDALRETLRGSSTWGPIAEQAMVVVPTSEVAKAGLLKTIIELDDVHTDNASRIKAALDQFEAIKKEAHDGRITLNPRIIFVTEESDRRGGTAGDPAPVAIWKLLTERFGVDPTQVAVATSTKELPQGAERVSDLSQLRERHRFLIFNKKFQEGWDDAEAYIAYFDGETKSSQRIKQIIGRIIRQPGQRAFAGRPLLNTASIFLSSPDTKFASIVEDIRKHLVEQYGTDDNDQPNVSVRTRAERPATVPLRRGSPSFTLPAWILEARTDRMASAFEHIAVAGRRLYSDTDRAAAGSLTRRAIDLTEKQKNIAAQTIAIGRHIRSNNRDFFLDRVRSLSSRAFSTIPESRVSGPMFEQDSAMLSAAQKDLGELALRYVSEFEDRVDYAKNPDRAQDAWSPRALEPTYPAVLAFSRSLHPSYPDNRSFLNPDEMEMAAALDATGEGWWMRNPPSSSMGGYGLPMPIKVGGSENFYPDFLWWVDDTCFAVDTTGLHILKAKVRGKLLSLQLPKVALVTRGKVGPAFDSLEDKTGWTLVLPGPVEARRLHSDDLAALLADLRRV
ncbi:MAG: hypothetical protein ACMG6H_04505, partial [Acidobacteriota bacterium]